jgi:hypothetical protein
MANEKRDYVDFDVDSFGKDLRKKYDAFKEMAAKARDLKKEFETQFVTDARKDGMIDATQDCLFGYNFGKFAVAVVGKEEKTAKKATAKPKLGFKR